MRFSVGYQENAAWIDEIVGRASVLDEVYFAPAGWASGRARVTADGRQLAALGRIADAGIRLCLLVNANCYGAKACAKSFFNGLGETVERFSADGSLACVTTTSPLVAKFVKDNFPDVATRASVNMEIGTDEGMGYLADVFDGYYLKRELNRDLAAVRHAKTWCEAHGKKLHLLANSGCLNFCSSRTFHDNLVAHEAEISPEKAKAILDEIYFYPPAQHAYVCSICGRACDVACYCHLEERGVLTKKFRKPFRTRPEWKFPLEDFR